MSYPKVSVFRYKSGHFRITRRYKEDTSTYFIMKEEFEKMKKQDALHVEDEA